MNTDKVSVNKNITSLEFSYLTGDISMQEPKFVFRAGHVLFNVTCSIYH